jgi:hypothetical protein
MQMGTPDFERAGDMTVLPGDDIIWGGYTTNVTFNHEAVFGKLDRAARQLETCDSVGVLGGLVREDTDDLTVWGDAAATASDYDAVASVGGLQLDGDSPTSRDELVCID